MFWKTTVARPSWNPASTRAESVRAGRKLAVAQRWPSTLPVVTCRLPVLIPAAVGGVAVVAAGLLAAARHPGWAFGATAIAAATIIATLFTGLYPRAIVSHPDFSNSLTIADAATAHYALSVITVVAAICTPVVLLYQGWAYHVFRARVGGAPSV